MNYLILLAMTLIGAFAGLLLKKASINDSFIRLLKSKFLYLGAVLYIFSAFLNIYLLQRMPYSVVLPLTSVTYIWTMLLSHFIIKEIISKKKIVGVILIIFGAVFIAI